MHPEAYPLMVELLERAPAGARVALDVGSYDVNGTYRPLVAARGWSYVGMDIRPGPNVDVVADPDDWGFEAAFDVVLSGSTLEHVTNPFVWMAQARRALRPGGLLAIVTHWQFPEHRYPLDTFRYLPDGMTALFDAAGGLADYRIWIANASDIAASALRD